MQQGRAFFIYTCDCSELWVQMGFWFETFNDEHNLPKALAEAQFVYLHMEIKSVFVYFWIHCLHYYMTKRMSNAFLVFYAATPLIYRLPCRSIFFSQQTNSMWEEKLWYASLCPPHWQCVCVCACVSSQVLCWHQPPACHQWSGYECLSGWTGSPSLQWVQRAQCPPWDLRICQQIQPRGEAQSIHFKAIMCTTFLQYYQLKLSILEGKAAIIHHLFIYK